MLFDAYELETGEDFGNNTREVEFSFLFQRENDLEYSEVHAFYNNNQNTYNLRS